MKTWLHSLRQKLHHYRVTIGVTSIILIVVIVLIIAGYWFDWTGFNGYNKITTAHIISGTNTGTTTRTEEYQPGKALWDWLQLLIIPLVLAIAALLFNLATTRTEQNIAAKRYEQDRDIALDKQREDLLQTYLDRMSDLLLEKQLRSVSTEEVHNVARVRTITVLFQLDARRIEYVFAFLREICVMSNEPSTRIVSLKLANLSKINFSGADIREADLSGSNLREANLKEANLSRAYLGGADLSGANLREANLRGANLRGVNLSGANLREANLREASLYHADLSVADLSGASLYHADLRGADLRKATFSGASFFEANLREADLSGATLREASLSRATLNGAILREANLSGVDFRGAGLSGADLKGAIGITIEILEREAKTLQDAIMPDGSKHS